ncbi:uncharacterized protein LOC124442321 [Xenia sp. Carnegie-2017]|uniref:uncharacterized protein LOC124442321 n=1 Tax=Xenia sp. Carnegie-2017 TaxID=2897299 RepID=UPI001F043940|nr:uncharacterized protein LOC124442321 [Xenia sp. Carnegie-2017]
MHGWYFYPCDLESNEEKDNNSSTIQEDDIALKVNLSRITPSVSPSREPASKVTLSFMKYSEQGTANTGREISRNVVETAAGAEDFVELENSVPNGNSSINLTVQCELAQDGHFSIVVNDSSSERESEDHNDTNDTKNQNEKILKISFVQRHENHVVDIALFSGAFVLFSLAAARLSN